MRVERFVPVIACAALVAVGVRGGNRWWRLAIAIAGFEMLRRGMGKRATRWRRDDERLDEMSMDSFPASDAPAY